MKKTYYLALAAIAGMTMLTGCSDDNLPGVDQPGEEKASDIVTFSASTGIGKQSRAAQGSTSAMTTETLKTSGFGVFAYFTGDDNYAGTRDNKSQKPNFMYNQKVDWGNYLTGTSATVGWKYEPVKYWPNGNAKADDQDNHGFNAPAAGEPNGKVSFFAYAPYYASDATTGEIKDADTKPGGIIGASAANAAGDPTITYRMDKNVTDGVDLLWGTTWAGKNGVTAGWQSGTKDNTGVTAKASTDNNASSYEKDILSGYTVNADLTKMKTGGKVAFDFKHALAKVGGQTFTTKEETTGEGEQQTTTTKVDQVTSGLQIMLDIDLNGSITGGDKPDATKVTVKKIEVTEFAIDPSTMTKTTTDNVTTYTKSTTTTEMYYNYNTDGMVSTLNLATGHWTLPVNPTLVSKSTTTNNVTTYNTGTKQTVGQSTTGNDAADYELNENIMEPATFTWDGFTKSGVKTTTQSVYTQKAAGAALSTEALPFYFIPGTVPEFDVKITYIVRTKDTKLEKGYSEVEQTVSKTVTFARPVEMNKRYTLVLRLGLTSVKFDAIVSDWTDGNPNVGTSEDYTKDDGQGGTTTDTDKGQKPTDSEGNVYVPINVESTPEPVTPAGIRVQGYNNTELNNLLGN